MDVERARVEHAVVPRVGAQPRINGRRFAVAEPRKEARMDTIRTWCRWNTKELVEGGFILAVWMYLLFR